MLNFYLDNLHCRSSISFIRSYFNYEVTDNFQTEYVCIRTTWSDLVITHESPPQLVIYVIIKFWLQSIIACIDFWKEKKLPISFQNSTPQKLFGNPTCSNHGYYFSSTYTPEDEWLEPKNHPNWKGKSSEPNHHDFRFHVNLPGCSWKYPSFFCCCSDWSPSTCNVTHTGAHRLPSELLGGLLGAQLRGPATKACKAACKTVLVICFRQFKVFSTQIIRLIPLWFRWFHGNSGCYLIKSPSNHHEISLILLLGWDSWGLDKGFCCKVFFLKILKWSSSCFFQTCHTTIKMPQMLLNWW